MSRFNIGDTVIVTSVIYTIHAGQKAKIVSISANKQGRTNLDKYWVELANGVLKQFWDIQLASANPDNSG